MTDDRACTSPPPWRRSFKVTRTLLCATWLTSVMLWAPTALADEEEDGMAIGAEAGLGVGLEGGAAESGFGFRRSRLRLLAGADIGGAGDHSFGVRVAAELEGRGSLGLELRYGLPAGPLRVFAGPSMVLAPESLFGVLGGVATTFPLFGPNRGLFIEGTFHGFPIGGDLPGRNVLIWALFNVGFHVGL